MNLVVVVENGHVVTEKRAKEADYLRFDVCDYNQS